MAGWQDSDHGAQAGAPDKYCFRCNQYCGGTDANGDPLVCGHCQALGLPPAGTDAVAENHLDPAAEGGAASSGNPWVVTTDPTGTGVDQLPVPSDQHAEQ